MGALLPYASPSGVSGPQISRFPKAPAEIVARAGSAGKGRGRVYSAGCSKSYRMTGFLAALTSSGLRMRVVVGLRCAFSGFS